MEEDDIDEEEKVKEVKGKDMSKENGVKEEE